MLVNPFAGELNLEVGGIAVIMMVVDTIFYFSLLWLMEEGFYIKRAQVYKQPSEVDIDDDVKEEETRVE